MGDYREFIVTFRARKDAPHFYEIVSGYRLPAKIVNTPSSAGLGCGLSVKMLVKDLAAARTSIERYSRMLSSYAGMFWLDAAGKAVAM